MQTIPALIDGVALRLVYLDPPAVGWPADLHEVILDLPAEPGPLAYDERRGKVAMPARLLRQVLALADALGPTLEIPQPPIYNGNP